VKILLLNPPEEKGEHFTREGRCTQQEGIWATLWLPISLVYIATLLKEQGHEAKVFDCPAENLEFQDVRTIIQSYAPEAVLWSTGTPSIDSDLRLSSMIKELNPSIATGVFGTHVTVLDQDCMKKYPSLDAIIRNEPEYTACEWVDALENHREFKGIQGLTYREGENTIVSNPQREFIPHLDALPFPDWSLIHIGSYRVPLKNEPFLMVMPLRGCPFSCNFCTCQTYYGKKLRLRSIQSVIDEIKNDITKYDIHYFFFWAETFTVNRLFIKELCREIALQGLNIHWMCNSRVDTVDEELLELMSKAGCWMISYGIESVDEEILKTARKNITLVQIKRAISLTRKNNILSAGHIIFGLPAETTASAEKTMKEVKGLGLDFAQFYCAVPFPGSELYTVAVEKGWITGQGFESFRQEKAVMSLPSISPDQVERIRKQAIKEFYGRITVMRNVLRLANVRALKSIASGAIKFLKGLF
jgi:anaerobic magnesium-protoporphyrin IX monomethyl ester cyclase